MSLLSRLAVYLYSLLGTSAYFQENLSNLATVLQLRNFSLSDLSHYEVSIEGTVSCSGATALSIKFSRKKPC